MKRIFILPLLIILFASCEKDDIATWNTAYLIDIDINNMDELFITDITNNSVAAEGGYYEKNGSGDYTVTVEPVIDDDQFIWLTLSVTPRSINTASFLEGVYQKDSRELPTDKHTFRVKADKNKYMTFRITYN